MNRPSLVSTATVRPTAAAAAAASSTTQGTCTAVENNVGKVNLTKSNHSQQFAPRGRTSFTAMSCFARSARPDSGHFVCVSG